jgi:hypothetical protein
MMLITRDRLQQDLNTMSVTSVIDLLHTYALHKAICARSHPIFPAQQSQRPRLHGNPAHES